ncbi:MAG: hypothetical protein L6V95_05550 [Candidatus Melainabacteria bacterium]|nr:MAG: hypothetical protein L6V95_05550 [Candidatus Melainabacteria bacterium]
MKQKAYTFKTFEPNGYQNYNNQNGFYNVENSLNNDYPKLTLIENTLFNTNFQQETVYNRLNRIERKLFRKTFENMDLASRVDNVIGNMENREFLWKYFTISIEQNGIVVFQNSIQKRPARSAYTKA